MNNITSNNPDRSSTYRTDAQHFFSRYPAVLFAFLFSGMFTLFSVVDALDSTAKNSTSYNYHVGAVALRAGEVGVPLFIFLLWRWRRPVASASIHKPTV